LTQGADDQGANDRGAMTGHQNKTRTQFFCDNFSKCGQILITLSLLHSEMNGRKSYYAVGHLASNLLPHYFVKFECSAVQLIQSKVT